MDWLKIGWALLIIMMIVFMWPRAKQMLSESRKATSDDWKNLLLPLLLVVGFVILLVASVRN